MSVHGRRALLRTIPAAAAAPTVNKSRRVNSANRAGLGSGSLKKYFHFLSLSSSKQLLERSR